MDMYLWRCLSVLISTIQLATIPLLQAQESTPGGVLNPQNNVFNVTDYGIAPNSQEDALPALKKALRKAEKYVKTTQQNAEVYFPSGSYNLSPCEVKLNNVNIHLGANAQIMALPKKDIPNPPSSYITFKGKNFVLYGEEGSLFDGNGATWWGGGGERPDFISLSSCQNYEVYGFTVSNSPNHTVRLSSCTNGKIHDLTITAPPGSSSTDGIDPMSNVDGLEIYNCTISNNDDCIAINSNCGPMKNIHIHDCSFSNGHGVSFGSALNYDITNVLIENVTIEGTQYGLRIKFNTSEKAARLENIRFNNIKATNLSRDAIYITTEYGGKPNRIASLKDIIISNYSCDKTLRALNLTLTKSAQALTPLILDNVVITNAQEKNIIRKYPVLQDDKPVK